MAKRCKEKKINCKPGMVGTTFKEIIEENGKTLEMYGVITKFVENKTIAFHIKSKIHEFNVVYSLEGRKKVTGMFIEAIIKWKFPMNIVKLFFGKKMKKTIIRQIESELIELKRLCESE